MLRVCRSIIALSRSGCKKFYSRLPSDSSHTSKVLQQFGTYVADVKQKIIKQEVLNALTYSKNLEQFHNAVRVMRSYIILNPTFGLVNDRTDLLHRLLEASYICGDIDIAWNTLLLFREQGMQMIRPHAYAMLNIIRKEAETRIGLEGRSISIIDNIYARLRSFISMSEEDGILMDYMLWTRYLVIMMQVVGLFDRQLVYKEKWQPSQVRKRDGVFVDYVLTEERLSDYDHAVAETYRLLDEILTKTRRDISTRPSFGFMYRLAELLFTCDDFQRMHSVLLDMKEMQMFYPDTLTSKLLQLAVAFNHSKMPDIFAKWRIYHENAILTTFDFFRLMAYYCRSGGGLPCPKCGDPSNHRDVSLEYWRNRATSTQKECEYLELAMTAKGEYNDILDIPQNADWSRQAFAIYEWAQQSNAAFGTGEWRLFLLCCTSSKEWKRALHILQKSFPLKKWDDILMGTVFRMLRFNAPHELPAMCHGIKAQGLFLHTLAMNEALMGVFLIEDTAQRSEAVAAMMKLTRSIGSPPYVYTIRVMTRIISDRMLEQKATEQEISVVNELTLWCKRLGERAKESFWDLVRSPATQSKVHSRRESTTAKSLTA